MLFYREYVATSIAPLTVGKTYNMTISVSLANNSRYATDGLGVFFSTYPINQPHLYTYLPVTPQVDYSNYGVITDTMNWVTLSKTFVADSAYTNLVVGCFKSDYTIKVKSFAKGVIEDFTLASYYYISRIGIPDSMSNDTTEEITVMPNITMYEFPNGFTPNGDGNNDIFRIIANMNIVFKKYSLSIYNRYGQLVFFTEDPADGWNGKFNDVPQDMGAYFYMAVLTVNDKEEVMKGDITLIR
jgi:gliding motility-associated-like protein